MATDKKHKIIKNDIVASKYFNQSLASKSLAVYVRPNLNDEQEAEMILDKKEKREEANTKLLKRWLTSEEAAAYLGISIGTLRNLTSNGHILYYKFRRLNRYKESDLDLLFIKNGEASDGN